MLLHYDTNVDLQDYSTHNPLWLQPVGALSFTLSCTSSESCAEIQSGINVSEQAQ